MAANPDQDLGSAIATLLGAPTWAVGTNVFTGPMRAQRTGVPVESIFCLATGGAPPSPYLGENREVVTTTVQVMLRGTTDALESLYSRAKTVRNGIHLATITGYIDVRVREAEPNYLGKDEADRHLFSLNVEMTHLREPGQVSLPVTVNPALLGVSLADFQAHLADSLDVHGIPDGANLVARVSQVADGAAAVAHVLDTSTAWTLGKLLSLRTDAVEKLSISAAGAIVASAIATFNGMNLGVSGGTWINRVSNVAGVNLGLYSTAAGAGKYAVSVGSDNANTATKLLGVGLNLGSGSPSHVWDVDGAGKLSGIALQSPPAAPAANSAAIIAALQALGVFA